MHMPVHGHSRPCQPDDVLTFSKNHLCVYKELPLLHNRSMHMPASAWIFGSKSIQVLYLLLRRHCRRALGPSLHLGGLSPNPLSCTLNNGDKYHQLCILIWLQGCFPKCIYLPRCKGHFWRKMEKCVSQMHFQSLQCISSEVIAYGSLGVSYNHYLVSWLVVYKQ